MYEVSFLFGKGSLGAILLYNAYVTFSFLRVKVDHYHCEFVSWV